MKKILIPTDFSDTAKGAFTYACHLAGFLGETELKVVNAFMPEVSGEYNFIPPMAEFLKMRETMLREFTEECRKELQDEGKETPKITQEVLVGFAVDELSRASADFDLIVMGTTGEGGFLGKLFGSVSTGVAQHAQCPVLLIPRGAGFQPYHHVLYACNYESADEEMIEELKTFNRPFNAHLHFIHVKEEGRSRFEKTKQEVFEELFEDGEPAFAFEIAEIEGETVSDGLSSYAETAGVDLAVMVTQRRGLWNQLFHKSQTKQMVFATNIPLLVFHKED